MPLPLFRPPPPEDTMAPMSEHSDSQTMPSFHPIIETLSIITSDQTARSPIEVESELEKLRAISTWWNSASTSSSTKPEVSAGITVLLISIDHPEIKPPLPLIVEFSINKSPLPETSNNVWVDCTEISLKRTSPSPRNRANRD